MLKSADVTECLMSLKQFCKDPSTFCDTFCKLLSAQDRLTSQFTDDLTFALKLLVVDLATYSDSFKPSESVTVFIQTCLLFLETLDNQFFRTFNCDERICLAVLVLGWDSWAKSKPRLLYYVLDQLKPLVDEVPLQ